MKFIVVHYDEIAMKGDNRRFFVRTLIRNIRRCAAALADVPVDRQYDRILLGPVPEADMPDAKERLAHVPGIAWFAEVRRFPVSTESLARIADAVPADGNGSSFRVRTQRSKKNFPLTSMEINRDVGRMIQERTGRPVDLEHAELTVYINVTPKGILVYHRKERGVGGLPVGASGRLIGLLSGGIDSPVAAYKMICRGCEVAFVHFHNLGPESGGVRRKIEQLAERFTRFQPTTRLYLVPFGTVQADLVAAVPPRMRMIAYRRAMLNLATPVLEREGAKGFVLGDSIGQVASQTLENVQATWPATPYPVVAPLIGENKQAIIQQARRIGTYEISTLPYEDCCQLLVARHPETRCTLEEITACEENLPMAQYREDVLREMELLEFSQSGSRRQPVAG